MAIKWNHLFFISIAAFLQYAIAAEPGRTRPVCDIGSCHPQTGNLLIGRANKLTATSTCGLNGPVNFCIVSHLEKNPKKSKKCFTCDSRHGAPPENSHLVENIIYETAHGSDTLTWWQSENGKEDVSIRLDLEAEFHFTHLIMKFRTFKPAALFVERSPDYGKTWKVYRYFAEKCDIAFPNITRTRQTNLTEVVCESNYWKFDTSTEGGEVILRIMTPSLQGKKNPYTDEVQELLKITNLRINFTKLFTLGDDLLDRRQQIQEKYYYAIYEMTVRGSCWCYGHAEQCLPEESAYPILPDMVYGKCNCTHNTTGLNCEKCKPTHNDFEWKAATGKLTNACKACNCNNHAKTCEFSRDVFIKSGQATGSVCDDCQHDTTGNNCEKCKPHFYHHPDIPINNQNTCQPCRCNAMGTIDDGLCDSADVTSNIEAGQCHCKKNVLGPDCVQCKPGFWNLDESNPDGCEPCRCHLPGTDNGTTCDQITGSCFCKEGVTGADCSQCFPEHWGLSDSTDGCQPCGCDIGGSLDTLCDVITGQCKCQPHLTGRICSIPEQSYFLPSIVLVYEAEEAKCKETCQQIERHPKEKTPYYTGTGFTRVFDRSELEFTINNITMSGNYDVVIRYERPEYDWADVTLQLERNSPIELTSICANSQPSDDLKRLQPRSDSTYILANSSLCLEENKPYKLRLIFKSDSNQVEAPSASILIDSVVLVPKTDSIKFFGGSPVNEERKQSYDTYQCNEALYTPLKRNIPGICKKWHFSISANIHGGAFECSCDLTGSKSSLCNQYGGECDCKRNVVGRKCDRCTSVTYGFSPEGCKDCDCNWDGALSNNCDVSSGQCPCKSGIYGRSCDKCQPGSWSFPNCKLCQCHGHAHTCNPESGECVDCRDFTTGHSCDQCTKGFYGEPKDVDGLPCRACRCPDTVESGHSFADTCSLDPITKDVQCLCNEGYSGHNCAKCDENYFGNPEEPRGGSCRPCACNNNIDLILPGNCDSRTGKCIQCLYNTTGDHCEICQANFYGNAIEQQCSECSCDILGTDSAKGPCDHITGQCPCLPNVEGDNCERCKDDYWGVAKGTGCISCECDPVGSLSTHCHEFTGECSCKDGFGGDKCNQCQPKFWGNPNLECFACHCNVEGSVNGLCHQYTGICFCREGIGGEKCADCAKGYNGTAPYCSKCGECFDNWEIIIESLADKTNNVIDKAGDIKRTGATGAYNSAFDEMTKQINDVQDALSNTKGNKDELYVLNGRVNNFRNSALNYSTERVNRLNNEVQNVISNISFANLQLTTVKDKAKTLLSSAKTLSDNATHLQEKDLKGALNLTRVAGESSKKVSLIEKTTTALLQEADRQCRRTENFLNKDNESFTLIEQKNDEIRQTLEFDLSQLEKKIPDLNEKICDKRGNPCHELCGGAKCSRCGGLSCEAGAVGKAYAGIVLTDGIKDKLTKQLKDAEFLYRQISNAKQATDSGKEAMERAHLAAENLKNQFERVVFMLSEMNKNFETFINAPGATPAEIRHIANEALNLNIQLKPQQIKELANQINETIGSLTNIQSILEDTRQNQTTANSLKQKSDEAKNQAEKILEKAQKVVDSLKAAKEAQDEAEKAINTAHEDITATKKDLRQIESETEEANTKAQKTHQMLQGINTNLKHLQSIVLNHANGAKQVSTEAKKISKEVQDSKNKVQELNHQYDNVINTVQKRSENSTLSKLRAQKLLEKARQLSVHTKNKFKELKDAEIIFNEQDKDLEKVKGRIIVLTESVDKYIEFVRFKSHYFRNCN